MEIIIDDETIDLGEVDIDDDLFLDDINLEDTLDLSEVIDEIDDIEVEIDE